MTKVTIVKLLKGMDPIEENTAVEATRGANVRIGLVECPSHATGASA